MVKAWKTISGTGKFAYTSVRYDEPSEEHMAHYKKHDVKVEEIEIKGPVLRLHYVITDGGDGSHGVQFFSSKEAISERYDDDGFEKGEDAYNDVPVEVDEVYIDLSDYEVIV
jgi:hypothetical protein